MDWNRFFRRVPKPLQPTRPCLELLEDRVVPSAPVLTLPGSQSKSEGQSVSIIVSATNPNNLTLTYSASTYPAGLSINTSTGLISGLVAYNNTSQGLTATLVASISVTDGTAGDSGSLSWSVADTDRLSSPASQFSTETSLAFLSLTASDATGTNALTYSVSGLPAGLTINTASGLISGTIAYSAVNGASTSLFTPTVTLTDNHGGVDTRVVSWTVTDTNRLPSVGALGSFEGQPASVNMHGTDFFFTDTLSYSVSNLPPGLTINTASGSISGAIQYSAVNSASTSLYTPTVTLTDNHGGVDTRVLSWTVTDTNRLPTVSQTTSEGTGVSLNVHGTDAFGTDTLTYSISGLPPGLTLNTSTALITGSLAYSIASTGATLTYTPTLTLTDNHGATDTRVLSWTVTDTNRLPSPASQSNIEGQSVSLNMHGIDAFGNTLTYSVSGLPAGLTIDTSSGIISGVMGYSDAVVGSTSLYTPTVTLTDNHGGTDTRALSWTVSGTWAINLTPLADQQNTEGQGVSLTLHGTDSTGGASLTYSASGLPSGLTISPLFGLITGTIAAGAGNTATYTPTITAHDATSSNSETLNWAVASAVTLTPIAPQQNTEGQSLSLTVHATDSTGGATLTYTASGLPGGLSVNPSTGIITGTITAGAGNTATFTPTVTASDGTSSTSATFNWNVASAVTLTPIAPQQNTEGQSLTLTVHATDSTGGATLTYSASGLPNGLGINASTGLISGTIGLGAGTTATFTPTITAHDSNSTLATSFNWNVASAVTVAPIAPQLNTAGNSLTLTVHATDATGGTTLMYSVSGLPGGLSINTSTGLITGTIALAAGNTGTYTPTVTANDGNSSSSETLNWTIMSGVTLAPLADQQNTEGQSLTLTVHATDSAGGATLTYSSSGLPGGLSVNASTGLITGTIGLGAGTTAFFTPTVTVSDGTSSTSATLNWNVASAITLTPIAGQQNAEGNSVSFSVHATDATASTTLTYTAADLPAGLSINASTGLISGTISVGAANAVFSPTVYVRDGTSGNSVVFNWNVDSAIAIRPIADQQSGEGGSVSFSIHATDATGGTTLTYSANGLPTGLSVNASTGLISGTIATGAANAGGFFPVVMVGDGTSSTGQGFIWNVAPAITVTPIADQQSAEGNSVSFSVHASDANTLTLSYSAAGLPAGLSINTSTGLISGTIAAGAANGGPYAPTIVINDGTSSNFAYFNWNVDPAITVTPIADQQNSEGNSVSFSVHATDATGGATLTYTALGLPTGLGINSSTGLISGTIAAGSANAGAYFATIMVGDGTSSAGVGINWSIDPVIVIRPVTDQQNAEGNSVSFSIPATDANTLALTYTAVGLPTGVSVNQSTGLISGTIAAGAANAGPYAPTIVVSDGASSNFAGFNWSVTAPITIRPVADQQNAEGNSVSFSVSANDANSLALAYSAAGLPTGLSINASTGLISGTIAAGAANAGPYAPTVTASDGTSSSSQSFSWNVNSALTLTPITDQQNAEGSSVSFSLSATDANTLAVTYSAVGLPTGLSVNASTGLISGTIAAGAANAGPYVVTVLASDGTASSSQGFNWNVPSAVSITVIDDQKNAEGSTVSFSVSASDANTLSLTYSAAGLPTGLSINPSTGLISGIIAAGAAIAGPYAPIVMVSDGTSNSSQGFSWNVASAVSISFIRARQNAESDSVSFSVAANDANTLSLTYRASGLPTGLSINPSTGLISGTIAAGAANASPYATTVMTSDGTSSSSQGLMWNVASAIAVTSITSHQNTEGNTVSFSVSASDTNTLSLTYHASGLPTGVSINPSTGLISGTIVAGAANAGPIVPVITASDGSSSATQSLTWGITSAVSLTMIADQQSTEGNTVSLSLHATDANTLALTYTASGLPMGLSINPTTGLIILPEEVPRLGGD